MKPISQDLPIFCGQRRRQADRPITLSLAHAHGVTSCSKDSNAILFVHVALPSVMITPSAAGTPTAGQTYSLSCSLTPTTDPVTYQWFDSNGTQLSNTSQLQFSPLLASHAGLYRCRATEGSVMAEGSTTVTINCKTL